jgi:choline transport protein
MALFLSLLLFFLIFAGNITALAATSRELWAFSRDTGFPYSHRISHVNHKFNVPSNAIYLSTALAAILCLINLGSSLAFNIIVSLAVIGILSTYILSIGCLLLKRIRNEPLPPARWSLGKLGLPINVFAVLYCGFIILFGCFPTTYPVTLDTANWAPLVWAAVIVFSVVVYWVHGRRHYTPPVQFVEGKRVEGQGFQGVI